MRSFIEGCTEHELTLPQLPYVPNMATYVFFSDLTGLVASHAIVSKRNTYITGASVSVVYLLI